MGEIIRKVIKEDSLEKWAAAAALFLPIEIRFGPGQPVW